MLIWGLCVIYRTLGRGVFFCRRCGGDREYRHRAGRRYLTVFFIPVIPLAKTGEHVQCLTCKIRYVTEVLKLPTTVQMQAAHVAGMRALAAITLRAGDPANPLARRRAVDAVAGAGVGKGDKAYDEEALDEDLAESAEHAWRKVNALGAQLQIEAREWCLAEAIRIAMADGPLTGAERAAAEHLASALGMTHAQAIGVITLTEQRMVLSRSAETGTRPAFGLICSSLICRTSCSSLAAAAGADKGWLPRRGVLGVSAGLTTATHEGNSSNDAVIP